MAKAKKDDASKRVAKQESGHKANPEGKKIPKVGKGPDEKFAKLEKKQMHAPAKMGNKKLDIPYSKHPMPKKKKKA